MLNLLQKEKLFNLWTFFFFASLARFLLHFGKLIFPSSLSDLLQSEKLNFQCTFLCTAHNRGEKYFFATCSRFFNGFYFAFSSYIFLLVVVCAFAKNWKDFSLSLWLFCSSAFIFFFCLFSLPLSSLLCSRNLIFLEILELFCSLCAIVGESLDRLLFLTVALCLTNFCFLLSSLSPKTQKIKFKIISR